MFSSFTCPQCNDKTSVIIGPFCYITHGAYTKVLKREKKNERKIRAIKPSTVIIIGTGWTSRTSEVYDYSLFPTSRGVDERGCRVRRGNAHTRVVEDAHFFWMDNSIIILVYTDYLVNARIKGSYVIRLEVRVHVSWKGFYISISGAP